MKKIIRYATKEDYNDIIHFADCVFNTNFKKLVPKIYLEVPDMASTHLLLKEEEAIKALACSVPMVLHSDENSIKISGIGTVCVSEIDRGKGFMQTIMNRLIQDAKEQGVDLLCLGGNRQRYRYYGFEHGATDIEYKITQYNCKHSKENSNEQIKIVLLKQFDNYTNDCKSLQQSGQYYISREKDEFCTILETWWGNAYVILINDTFAGYFSGSEQGEIREINVVDSEMIQDIICAIVQYYKTDIKIHVTMEQRKLISQLSSYAEECRISTHEMIKVLNFPKVVQVFLERKSKHKNLLDGELILEVKNNVKFRIKVENNKVSVDETIEKPDLLLSETEMINRLFSFSSEPLLSNILECSWFPIPISLPIVDMV